MKAYMLMVVLVLALPAWAAEPIPEPLVPPPEVESELIEPEVTIRESEDQTIYEYRVNGQIYMVKIQPSRGPAYYLMDLDGDGDMDVQGDDPARIVVPHWVFFRW
ncbi:MAG: DUF2782 domain-containing protein [bacterium]